MGGMPMVHDVLGAVNQLLHVCISNGELHVPALRTALPSAGAGVKKSLNQLKRWLSMSGGRESRKGDAGDYFGPSLTMAWRDG